MLKLIIGFVLALSLYFIVWILEEDGLTTIAKAIIGLFVVLLSPFYFIYWLIKKIIEYINKK